jgi:leader peptidase (prepilin peptidase)/N-methyltransferase
MNTAGIGEILPYIPPGFRIALCACFFFLGATFSDFFQCMIYRRSKRISLFIRRSFCDSCGKRLRWFHLIPVVSFFLVKGKCAYCGAKIDPMYMLSDFFAGVMVVLLASSRIPIPFLALFSLMLVFVSAHDFLSHMVPVLPLFLLLCVNLIYGYSLGNLYDRLFFIIAPAVSLLLLILGVVLRVGAVRALALLFINAI